MLSLFIKVAVLKGVGKYRTQSVSGLLSLERPRSVSRFQGKRASHGACHLFAIDLHLVVMIHLLNRQCKNAGESVQYVALLMRMSVRARVV